MGRFRYYEFLVLLLSIFAVSLGSPLDALKNGTTSNPQPVPVSPVRPSSKNETKANEREENPFGGLKFIANFYNSLRKSKSGEDIFFSPFSISSALSMLRAGAVGETETQIAKGLGASENLQNANSQYRRMLDSLKQEANPKVTLAMANRVYTQSSKDFVINEKFNKTLKDMYDSAIEQLDFVKDPEAARHTINDWVENVTRDKIKDLLPTGSISEVTRMVLANAVYFKGDWAQSFDESSTSDGTFYMSELTNVTVPMMRTTDEFAFKETEDATIVDLPYQGNDVVMTLVVPKERFGLSAIENKLDASTLHDYVFGGKRRITRVQLTMPKFKIESSFSLKQFLRDIGMVDMFDSNRANFSRISNSPDLSLYVDDGYHKAYVEVNEKGTEAAAATGFVVTLTSIVWRAEVTADHPFLFILHHRPSEEILFLGRAQTESAFRPAKS